MLVTNFACQHSVWIMSLEEVEAALRLQAQRHAELAELLMSRYSITYRRIFYSAVAVQGFRTGGLTPARQVHFNKLAREILVPAGWEILDAYNITDPRPDGTFDGLHYYGGVSAAIGDVLLNMLCNKQCRQEDSTAT